MATHVLRVPVSTGDTSLQKAIRDDLLKDDNGGVLFCADLGFGWSYPAGNLPRPSVLNPSPDSLVRDIAEKNNAKVTSSDIVSNITHVNGGFNFYNILNTGSPREVGIEIPAAVNAQLNTEQNYMFCMYMTLPPTNKWNTDGGPQGIVTSTDVGGNYQNDTESFLISMTTPVDGKGVISIRMQTSIGSAVRLDLEIPTGVNFYGSLVQVALYVKDGSVYVRAKDYLAEVTAQAAFTGNTEDFSNQTIKVGGNASGLLGNKPHAYKIYRTFVEDLSVSGRDPLTVLNADFVRVIARGVGA